MADGASSLDSGQGLLRYVFQTIVEGFLSNITYKYQPLELPSCSPAMDV